MKLRYPVDAAGFRGFTAPASLKPMLLRASGSAPAAFPGLYRPGLIEAEIYGAREFDADMVSGALPPRPH